MSIAEKLEALHTQAEDAALIALREGWEGGQCCTRAGDIIQALEDFPLPQIVAVVEAAEAFLDEATNESSEQPWDVDQDCRFCRGHFGEHYHGCEWEQARDALAALESALENNG